MMAEALGFDVGGTHLRVTRVWRDDNGELHHGEVTKVTWRSGHHPADAELLIDVVDRLVDRSGVSPDAPIGMGIAGQLDRDGNVVVNGPNLGWRNEPLAAPLEAWLGRRVKLLNDLDAILLGEQALGRAKGYDEVLACYVGTGVGGSIVTGGRLVIGASGNAGEIGHIKVPGAKALCGCGEIGCIETIAGGRALDTRLAEDLAAGRWSGEPRVSAVDRAAAAGDPYAMRVWGEVSDALGHVLGGLCTALNPQLLLLGGGVLERAPELLKRVMTRTSELTLAVARANLVMDSGVLRDAAGALGAGAAALDLSGAASAGTSQ